MCNYEDEEPLLKQTKPFVFEKRLRRLDWRLLHAVDLDRLIQKVDIDMLESAVETIAFGDLEMEDTCNFTEHNFCKLFRLAQLIVEFLLYNEQMLSTSVTQLRGERKQHVRQLHSQRRECKAQKEELHRLQKDIRRMKKQLRTYEIVLKLRQTEAPKPDPNQLHRCQLCEKQFESAYYLELHLKRRHGAAEDDAARMAAAGQGGSEQMTQMRLELNQLRMEKEQALVTEADLREQLRQAGGAGGARPEDRARAQHDAAAVVLKNSQEVEEKLEAAKGDLSKQLEIVKEQLIVKTQRLAKMEADAQYTKEMMDSYETHNERLKKQLEEYQFKSQSASTLTRPGVEEPSLRPPGLGDALEDDVDAAELMVAHSRLKTQQQEALIRFEEERASLQASLERATNSLQRLQDERGRLERQLDAAQKRVEALEAQNARLRNEPTPHAPQVVQVGRAPAGTLSTARPGEEEHEDEARRLADERAALQAERASLQAERSSLKDERAALQDELAALAKKRERLEADALAHDQQAADLLHDKQILEEQKAKLERERASLQEEQANLEKQIKELEMRERDLANAQKRQAREDKRSKQHTDEGSDKLQKEAVEDAERAAERITSAAREEAERIVQDAKATARRDSVSSAGRDSHRDVPKNEQRKVSGALSDSGPQQLEAGVQPKRRASMFSGLMGKKPPRPPAASASEAESDGSVSGARKKKWSFGLRKPKAEGEGGGTGIFGRGLSFTSGRRKSGGNSDDGEPGEMAIRPAPADREVAPLPPAPTKPKPSAGSKAVDIARRASAADDSDSDSEQEDIPEDIMEEGEEEGDSDSDGGDNRQPAKEMPTERPKSKVLMLEQICAHFDGDGDGFLLLKEVLQLLMQAGHASTKKEAGDMAEEMFKDQEDFLDDDDRLSYAGMEDWYKTSKRSLPEAWDAVFAGPSRTAGQRAPPRASVPPKPKPAVEPQDSGSEPEHTTSPHQHVELTTEEKEEFERRYPYAPLEDKPYVVTKHIHEQQKFEEVRNALLPDLLEDLEEMLQEFGVPENATGLSNDKYRQCMEKLEKRRKQRMNLMSSETRAREIRERKLLLRHLQDSATDHQKHANASEALPTSYAAAEASRSPPPVASRTAMAKRASIDSDSGSDSDAEPVTAMRPAPGGGSGAREWEGGWRESSGGRYGHGSSDLGAASLQEKRKQQQSQAASAEPASLTKDQPWDSDADEDDELVQAFSVTPSPVPKPRRGLDGIMSQASNLVGPVKAKEATETVSDSIESLEDEVNQGLAHKSSVPGGPSKDRSSLPTKDDSDEEDEVQAFMSETLDADILDRDNRVATKGPEDIDIVNQELGSMELEAGFSTGAASSHRRRISQESDISDVEEIQ